MNKNRTVAIQFCLIALLLFSCRKEHSRRWVVVDITVLDYHTLEPIEYDVILTYIDTYGFGENTNEKDSVGSSDNAGNFKMERHIAPGSEKGFQLRLYGPGKYADNGPNWKNPMYIFLPKSRSANKKVIFLKQYRKYDIHLENTNCNGPQDSVWIHSPGLVYGDGLYTGCMNDTVFNHIFQCFGRYQEENISITVTAKKNGVTTTTTHNFPLQMGNVNHLNIEY